MYGNEALISLRRTLEKAKNARKSIAKNSTRNIDDLLEENELYLFGQEGNDYIIKDILKKLPNAHHFHIDSKLSNVKTFLDKQFEKEQQSFMGDLGLYVNLPYDLCWIDFEYVENPPSEEYKKDLVESGFSESDVLTSKNGLIVENVFYNGHTFLRILFTGNTLIHKKSMEWIVNPFVAYVKVGHRMTIKEMEYFHDLEFDKLPFDKSILDTMKKLIRVYVRHEGEENLINSTCIPVLTLPLTSLSEKTLNLYRQNVITSTIMMSILNLFLLTLNCKNVETVNNYHMKKFVNSKNKTKLIPVKSKFQYKTLELILPTKKNKFEITESANEISEQKKIHFCRGNYATYTEDKPLFGHTVGRIWRNSHVKGSKEQGVLIKDYNVTGGV